MYSNGHLGRISNVSGRSPARVCARLCLFFIEHKSHDLAGSSRCIAVVWCGMTGFYLGIKSQREYRLDKKAQPNWFG